MNNEQNNKNGILIIILLAVVAVLVLFFPKIYDLVMQISMPKIDEKIDNETEKKKEINEEILETIHYPKMRNGIYNQNTYYTKDVFTINDLSNNDILYNAFLDIYEGNMTSYENVGACTTVSKQFNVDYLKLRIKNILSKNLNYSLSDFNVPEGLDTKYPGTWVYDAASSRYLYRGLCNSNTSTTKYYDLEQLVKLEYADNQSDILAYYYVGFAKVQGSNYIIYKDANMKEELTKGTFTSVENLNEVYKSLNNKKKKIYKYTFKNTLCTYNEYCLYEGRWVNEL